MCPRVPHYWPWTKVYVWTALIYCVKYPPKFNFVILCWTFFISLDFLYSPFKFAFRSLNILQSTFKLVFYIHKFSFYSTVRILHSSLHLVHWTFCIRHSSLYSTFISSHFIRLFAFYIQVCILFKFFNCKSNRNPRGMSDRGLKRWFAPFAPQNKDSRGFKMADREYVVTAINDVLTTLNAM
jgi:hypothetical protein